MRPPRQKLLTRAEARAREKRFREAGIKHEPDPRATVTLLEKQTFGERVAAAAAREGTTGTVVTSKPGSGVAVFLAKTKKL